VSALDPLNNVVAWIIMKLHAGLGALFGPASGLAWGLSIVILVVLIRLCLVPLFVKQVHAQRKMAQHAPQLQELRKKYKGDKQRLNEETMKFYKENGVNPLAGCLPMIPQMIVFFALFSVLRAIANWKPGTKPAYGLTIPVVASAQKATIFGVHLGDKLLFRPAGMHLTWQQSLVILLTVVISATTTFMTVRQSAKRGLMQTNVDPDNPAASMQKYMQYVIPFFSLTGLYWQYGLVLYWVTTNLWTLGQQYFMFRNWSTEPVGAEGALAGASIGGPVKTTQNSVRTQRQGSGTAKAASGTAKAPSGTARTGTTAGTARTGSAGSARAKGSQASGSGSSRTGSTGSAGTRTGTASRPATTASAPASGQNGGEKRGLLRLGRSKPEPEPQDDVPTTRVVRQQPVRQAKSKRSGKR
jgi:YidC/Oxa1 family membrane protein insertase